MTEPTLPAPITVPIDGEVTVPLDSLVPLPPGIPEVDSTDPLCRDLARLAGTASLVSIAVSFGGLQPDEVRRIEVIAAPLVLETVASVVENLPAAVADDRAALRATYLDPRAERARRAVGALETAGARDVDLAALAEVWLEILRTDDQIDPSIVVPDLPVGLERIVVAATDALEAEWDIATPPSTSDRMPAIEQYLLDSCPEVLGLLGADSV